MKTRKIEFPKSKQGTDHIHAPGTQLRGTFK